MVTIFVQIKVPERTHINLSLHSTCVVIVQEVAEEGKGEGWGQDILKSIHGNL